MTWWVRSVRETRWQENELGASCEFDKHTDRFEEFGLLIFEGVEPTPAMQVAISNVIGPLKDHPSQAVHRAGGDDMLGVIEMRHEPNAPGRIAIEGRELASWLPWHFDHCYNDQLNRAGVLRAVEAAGEGGLTGFVDGIALYDAISPEVRDRIDGKTVIYAMDVILENLRYAGLDRPCSRRAEMGSSARPA